MTAWMIFTKILKDVRHYITNIKEIAPFDVVNPLQTDFEDLVNISCEYMKSSCTFPGGQTVRDAWASFSNNVWQYVSSEERID